MTHAQSIEDGLGGHWTFDKADTDAKVAKDALGENDGEIKGPPKVQKVLSGKRSVSTAKKIISSWDPPQPDKILPTQCGLNP